MLFSPGWRGPTRQGGLLAVFTLGLVLGGMLSAAVLWLLSGLATPLGPYGRSWAIVAVAALGVAREFGLVAIPLPQNARQIPQEVLQRRLRLGTLQFGLEMGTGVRTYVSASTPYVIALGLLAAHQDAAATLAVGAAFGLGRALTPALTLAARDPDRDVKISVRLGLITRCAAVIVLAALALLLLPPH